jgi:hypothetical protein
LSVDIFEFTCNITRSLVSSLGICLLLPVELSIVRSMDFELGITKFVEITEGI